MTDTEITYGRIPLGQLIYDLGFAKLTDKWIARKYMMPIADVRRYRAAVRRGLRKGRKKVTHG